MKFSLEVEYQATALGTCELMWPWIFPYELGFIYKGPMVLHFDSTSAQEIATNPEYHSHTKPFEVDVDFIRERLKSKDITVKHIHIDDQLVDFLTKAVSRGKSSYALSKLGMRGSVKE